MEFSVTEAKVQLTDLVRRAEAGEEVVLTRHGQPTVRLVPLKKRLDRAARRELLEELQRAVAGKVTSGPSAARSQDFLYDEQACRGDCGRYIALDGHCAPRTLGGIVQGRA